MRGCDTLTRTRRGRDRGPSRALPAARQNGWTYRPAPGHGAGRMTQNILERLAATNPDAEIWWDSSPLIYPSWKAETLAKAPESKRAEWAEQLTRLYDNETIHEKGT